ncbi:hypothetical protein ZWY2020_038572 [Hordeum vulgare]|nr:hypothetical protein ZWY2020_038572 [Hordeum vulgare]
MAMRQGGRGDHTTSMAMALAVGVAVLFLAGVPRTAQAAVAVASAGIEEACQGAAERDAAVDYAHCVASLSSDREGRDAADMHALAAAATRMAVEHAAATEARMEGLGEAEGSPARAPGWCGARSSTTRPPTCSGMRWTTSVHACTGAPWSRSRPRWAPPSGARTRGRARRRRREAEVAPSPSPGTTRSMAASPSSPSGSPAASPDRRDRPLWHGEGMRAPPT